MTTIPTEAPAATPNAWVLRRTDPGGDEVMPGEDTAAGQSDLGFGDLLDVLNPLQHLPVVGTIYRALTGDTMSDAARMAGGALYGGPFGLVAALTNVVVERESGQDIGDTAMAWLSGGPDAGAETAVADAAGTAPATDALPINAAPVTVAAAAASPAAQAARTQQAKDQAATIEQRAAHATTAFQGRSADRLDAFIQQASAVRRGNPLAMTQGHGAPAARAASPGVIATAELQAGALKPPGIADRAERPKDRPGDDQGGAELALAGGDAGSVNEWMLRALDKYEHMRRREQS